MQFAPDSGRDSRHSEPRVRELWRQNGTTESLRIPRLPKLGKKREPRDSLSRPALVDSASDQFARPVKGSLEGLSHEKSRASLGESALSELLTCEKLRENSPGSGV
jgi:hypothetical protein